jgi:Fanconi anemia group M protein
MIKINEVKSKLFIDNVEVRTRNDSDVKNYVQEVEKEWVAVEFTIPLKSIKRYLESAKEERIKKLMSWNVLHSTMVTKTQMLKLQQELARKKKGYSYAAMSVLAEVIKIDHALLLLETQCLYSLKKYSDSIATQASSGETKAAVRIMKDENFMNAIRLTSELINEGKEHPKMEKMKEIVQKELEENKYARIMIFAQYRDTITKICEVLKEIRTASPVEFIGQAKKKGKGLSQKEQMQILNEFKMGFYNILVASQVGEEGLDVVETNMVIFYEPVPSAIRRVQRAGRTGRTQEGKVVTLITKNTRDEAYHWSGHQKEKKMTGILYNMKKQSDLKSFDRD